jgi:hypothetical protein
MPAGRDLPRAPASHVDRGRRAGPDPAAEVTPAALLVGMGVFLLIIALGVITKLPEIYRRYPPPLGVPEARETPTEGRRSGSLTELELANLRTEHSTLPQFALGWDPSHCDQCKQVAEIRQRQRDCPHEGDHAEMRSMDGRICAKICNDCGADLTERRD